MQHLAKLYFASLWNCPKASTVPWTDHRDFSGCGWSNPFVNIRPRHFCQMFLTVYDTWLLCFPDSCFLYPPQSSPPFLPDHGSQPGIDGSDPDSLQLGHITLDTLAQGQPAWAASSLFHSSCSYPLSSLLSLPLVLINKPITFSTPMNVKDNEAGD